MTQTGAQPALPDRSTRFERLVHSLRLIDATLRVRLNRNRSTLISLRENHGWTLSLHERLLEHPEAMNELPRWIARRGRGSYPALDHSMHAVMRELREVERSRRGAASVPALPTLAGPLKLNEVFDRVHDTWFGHLPKPAVAWSRQRQAPRQRHIRFGCYRRKPSPLITLHPRLDQPWVAQAFVEHVLYHELCHHAQACSPVRGEPVHSPRFRAWEQRFPLHAEVMAWERAHLDHFLDGSTPE